MVGYEVCRRSGSVLTASAASTAAILPGMGRKLRTTVMAGALLLLSCVPLSFIAYGSIGPLLGGLLFLAPLTALQTIVLQRLRRQVDSNERSQLPE